MLEGREIIRKEKKMLRFFKCSRGDENSSSGGGRKRSLSLGDYLGPKIVRDRVDLLSALFATATTTEQ